MCSSSLASCAAAAASGLQRTQSAHSVEAKIRLGSRWRMKDSIVFCLDPGDQTDLMKYAKMATSGHPDQSD